MPASLKQSQVQHPAEITSVCAKSIHSTGRTIVAIKAYDHNSYMTTLEIFFADGTVHQMFYAFDDRRGIGLLPVSSRRLPLNPGEKVHPIVFFCSLNPLESS